MHIIYIHTYCGHVDMYIHLYITFTAQYTKTEWHKSSKIVKTYQNNIHEFHTMV